MGSCETAIHKTRPHNKSHCWSASLGISFGFEFGFGPGWGHVAWDLGEKLLMSRGGRV